MKAGDFSIHQIIREYGYKIKNWEREEKRGGGLLILYKNYIKVTWFKYRRKIKFKTFEYICCKCSWNNNFITLVKLYRPTYTMNHQFTLKMFIKEFEEFLPEFSDVKGSLLIVVDFNINVNGEKDANLNQFLKVLRTYSITQLVKDPTHIKGGTIDLVLTEDCQYLDSFKVTVDKSFNTDHYPICIQMFGRHISRTATVTRKHVRELHKLDIEKFREDLLCEPIIRSDVFINLTLEECLEKYNTTLTKLLDKHCPLTKKTYRSNRNKSGWFNEKLQKLKQTRRQKERKFMKHPTPENKLDLRNSRNHYNFMVKETRSKFYNKQID